MSEPVLDIEKARFNMVEQQIRPWWVDSAELLDALMTVKREEFVPANYVQEAFMDVEIPLDIPGAQPGSCMVAPKISARLIETLALKPSDSVLEVGTGSGYQAALMAKLSAHVVTLESDPVLAEFAKKNLEKAEVSNVSIEMGSLTDKTGGWISSEFTAILINGAMNSVPDDLKYQLAIGGRMVVILGIDKVQHVTLITRRDAASFEMKSIFETQVTPAQGQKKSRFKPLF